MCRGMKITTLRNVIINLILAVVTKKAQLVVQNVELDLMSFDPNNPTQIIKDGLIFAAISQVVAFATRRAADFARDLPDNEEEFYEDEEFE